MAEAVHVVTTSFRLTHPGELTAALAGPLGGRTADDWFAELTAAGVPCGPINDLAAAFGLADRLGLAPRVPESAAGPGQVANPIRLGATPPSYRAAPPRLGEHTDAVLGTEGRTARTP
ncbi:CoA transferase [Streptomyces sp. NPDC056295]|uniref:CoA transferase n=1 Tax=Streptomyces sp. NPDC056295 TaxID=3345774 RepID=UPI0035E211D2